MTDTTTGAQRIVAERARQLATLNHTPEHDDLEHDGGELNFAAQAYAQEALEPGTWPAFGRADFYLCPPMWPWEARQWDGKEDPVENLVRAGALIAAEIDRLLRARG